VRLDNWDWTSLDIAILEEEVQRSVNKESRHKIQHLSEVW
jgi:hypothetical protein